MLISSSAAAAGLGCGAVKLNIEESMSSTASVASVDFLVAYLLLLLTAMFEVRNRIATIGSMIVIMLAVYYIAVKNSRLLFSPPVNCLIKITCSYWARNTAKSLR